MLAALAVQALPHAAFAQDSDRERGGLVVGAFITDRDSSTRLDSENGEGTEISLEDDLGLESSMSVGRLGGYFWFNDRHRVDAEYFDLSREASRPINETIDFGDTTFEINTVLESRVDFEVYKVDYTFAVLSRDRGFLGINGGLYIASTKFSLRQATLGAAESETVTAPLPVIGLRGEFAITDRITAHGAIQLFAYETDDVDGRFSDVYFGADFAFTQRLGVGLAYNDVSLNLGVAEDDFDGRLNWGYDGLLLYLKFDFGN